MNNIINNLKQHLSGKNITIIGFGREGRSTYNFIKKYVSDSIITIADMKEIELETGNTKGNNIKTKFHCGETYLDILKKDEHDIIIKSPGVSLKDIDTKSFETKITSQMDLFLKYSDITTIGITGTKGKSTTSSLLYNILSVHRENIILAGNIGLPVFDVLDDINSGTIIVIEMSSHQLEYIKHSPNIAVLLNIFKEHLDFYRSYKDYQQAKFNIFKYQKNDDYCLLNIDNEIIETYLNNNNLSQNKCIFSLNKHIGNTKHRFDLSATLNDKQIIITGKENILDMFSLNFNIPLKGKHNLYNITPAILISYILEVNKADIIKGITTYTSLPHRLEFIGTFNDVDFYNDSISTIPESVIQGINAIENTETIILGGYDRGIDYTGLAEYLCGLDRIKHIILLPDTGYRIMDLLKHCIDTKDKTLHLTEEISDAVIYAKAHTTPGKACLFSPGASSYNKFKNYEERGNYFKTLVKGNS